jgi:hypothetical protein
VETNNLLSLLQYAAKEATPSSDPQRTTNNIPYEIKKLVAEKGRAKSICQRTHTSDNRRKYNRTSDKLNQNSKKCGMNSLKNTSLISNEDNSIWKPIKIRECPKQHQPQHANIQHPRNAE